MDAVKIGNAIKDLRIQRNMTQADLAKCLDVTDKAVSKWERGIGTPDISMITKLSSILNTDIDNLLEGNLSYLEHSWHGVLILKDRFYLEKIYGKPSVYFPLCYFILAGIRNITVVCDKMTEDNIAAWIGDGEALGVSIIYQRNGEDISLNNSMIIWGTPFLFGINLTRYFQRAISNLHNSVVLTVPYNTADKSLSVAFDEKGIVQKGKKGTVSQCMVPILFARSAHGGNDLLELPLKEIVDKYSEGADLCAQPFGLGMLYKNIENRDDALGVSNFIHFYEKTSGNKAYCIAEVAWRRGFITQKEYQELLGNGFLAVSG